MSRKLKVSQGEFEVYESISSINGNHANGEFSIVEKGNEFLHRAGMSSPYEFWNVTITPARANAELFCDAINTANKLDKLPSELAADREMLLNAVKAVAAGMEANEDRKTLEQIIKRVEG